MRDKDPGLLYYALIILTIFNVLSLLIWFSITNLIRITSPSRASIDPSSFSNGGGSISTFSGTGNGNEGVVKFTTAAIIPQGSIVRFTVSLPHAITGYEVAVIGITAGNYNANGLNYPIVEKGVNYFVFENGFPFEASTTYTASYIIVSA